MDRLYSFAKRLLGGGFQPPSPPQQSGPPVPCSTLKLIGYWAAAPHWTWASSPRDGELAWPDIRRAVWTGWSSPERERVAAYLRSGHRCRGYLGFSACRFECRSTYRILGSGELTDGEWIWPEGLVHYVERHGVVLPEEFVASAAVRGWRVPPVDQVEGAAPGVLLYRTFGSDEATRSQIYERIRACGCTVDNVVWFGWANRLPEASTVPSSPDPKVMERFSLVVQYTEASGDDGRWDDFDEGVWEKVGEHYGRHAPNVENERVIEGIAVEQREAVVARVLDGLRRCELMDRVKVIYSAPDPDDWQRDRDVTVWPQGGAAEPLSWPTDLNKNEDPGSG